MWGTQGFGGYRKLSYLCTMFITKVTKYRKDAVTGAIYAYPYYRLSMSYRCDGATCKRTVMGLGSLEGLTKAQRDRLADLLTLMIEKGETVLCEDVKLYEMALDFYNTYRETKYGKEKLDPKLKADAERKAAEERRDLVTIKLSSLTQREARTIGPENLCNSTLRMLGIRGFLMSKGWSREQTDIALMQIISRAIYPYSEYKTVRYLRENSALAEMFKVAKGKITKDVLYQSALRLWNVHGELEDWLHERVCSMFAIEEKILLFDITNTYFEGRYDESEICRYGMSKEKRSDCKIVVLAAVVNTEGLIVRTMIYEGNVRDSKTLEEVVGSLSRSTSAQDARRVVVMDAGFYTKDNIRWLVDNGYDYITVLPAGNSRFRPTSDEIIHHTDCKGQEIRLQMGQVEIDGAQTRALLVDSDMKAVKEKSMWVQACDRYEEGLKEIRHGIETKGGTKKRDAVNKRIGKLDQKYGATRKSFKISLKYERRGKDEVVTSMEWTRDAESIGNVSRLHGKYVLITNLDESEELNIWKFYNVIRTVEETFHVLKTDLDVRPVYHKSDDGIKAHLNLAVLAYWLVSVTKYRLKIKEYPNIRWDEIIRIASTQVLVTADMETENGGTVSVRQSTEAEEKLATIYSLLEVNPQPLGKRKSVGHPKPPPKNNDT